MFQGNRRKRVLGPKGGTGQRGFSLVEVLVVLAILVILFGLLFAPMMAGMEMASNGRAIARLQDSARLAAEQMQRELSDAMYVYPLPTLTTASGPVTDYSQVMFVPPATDPASGAVLTPLRPRADSVSGETLVTRYCVRPPDTSGGKAYNETNPFVLVRQEGICRLLSATGQYEFGSYDPPGVWVPGRPITENALTPREEYDIPATTTVCRTCGAMEVGYVDKCKVDSSTDLAYLHRDVQFVPERVMGEALKAAEHNTLYASRYGNWMGTPNNGTVLLAAGALPASESEMQPRIVVYRWDSTTAAPDEPSPSVIALDTFSAVRSDIALRWNSADGEVRIGDTHTVHVAVNPASPPAPLSGNYYTVTVDGDAYGATGTLGGPPTAAAMPVYPKPPTQWGEPRMPISFRLEPGRSDGPTLVPAKVVPQSTSVVVMATSGSDVRRADLTRVENPNQSEIGRYEYNEYLDPDGRGAEIRLNRFTPPTPDDFTGLTAFDIYITYYYRRNFDPITNRDDVVYASYSTGEIINITLIPQRYTELENYEPAQPNLVVPADQTVGGVPVHLKAVTRNGRR
jgi:prepilin-type N-terminal cleavage/methylation domain-containing protein